MTNLLMLYALLMDIAAAVNDMIAENTVDDYDDNYYDAIDDDNWDY